MSTEEYRMFERRTGEGGCQLRNDNVMNDRKGESILRVLRGVQEPDRNDERPNPHTTRKDGGAGKIILEAIVKRFSHELVLVAYSSLQEYF